MLGKYACFWNKFIVLETKRAKIGLWNSSGSQRITLFSNNVLLKLAKVSSNGM
jgi:hypothetical protein